jgi:hypothetical protein
MENENGFDILLDNKCRNEMGLISIYYSPEATRADNDSPE